MSKELKTETKVVLVGAGPGDPDLISLKGIKSLKAADVVIYDYLANNKLLEYCNPGAEKIFVGKRAGTHSLSQIKINQLLVTKAGEKNLVVRLKGGDPFIFGRGGEEVLALFEAGINFEVIPGITAGTAALCYAGIPATHRGDATSVSFITGHEDPTKPESGLNWQALAALQGTLVFYMGINNLPKITENLIKNGKNRETPIVLVRWGTLPKQQTVTGNLDNIAARAKQADLQPPALIVVGDVVRYRDKMNWYEKKPLFGKKVVITRSRAQSSDLREQLNEFGADVIEFPTIRIEPPESWLPLDEAILNLEKYDWIVFTSVNGVENFKSRLMEKGYDLRQLKGIKIAAIGPATAGCLKRFGISADLQPEKYVAEVLFEEFKKRTKIRGENFLLPRAEQARVLLKEKLVSSGAYVDEVVAYRTIPETGCNETIIEDIRSGNVNIITFASSSTVTNFIKLIGKDQIDRLEKVDIACIGPITKQTAAEFGLKCNIMPEDYTIPGMVAAIVDFYAHT